MNGLNSESHPDETRGILGNGSKKTQVFDQQHQVKANNYQRRYVHIQISDEQNLGDQSPLEESDKPRFYPWYHGQKHLYLTRFWFWHLFAYAYELKTMVLNLNTKIRYHHLPNLSKDEDIASTFQKAQNEITRRKSQISTGELVKLVFFGELKFTVILVLIGFCMESAAKNAMSLVMSQMIYAISIGDNQQAYLYTLLLIGLLIVSLFGRHHGYYKAMQFSSKARMVLVNLIYKKLTELSAYSIKEANIGKILNLVSGDINMLEFNFIYIFQSSVLPIALIFGSAIMWNRFDGPIGLLSLAIIFVAYPIQVFIQRRNGEYLKNIKAKQDARLKLTNELVEGIRLIKMYAWEEAFYHMITTIRTEEFKNLLKYSIGNCVDRSFSYCAQVWSSCIFFIIVYYGNYKRDITTQDMIATLQLLSYFKFSCVFYVSYGMQAFITIKLSFERLANLISIQNQEMTNIHQIQYTNDKQPVLELKEFTQYWTQNITQDTKPVLQNINLEIHEGEFWGIIGKVGSGKSSLLNCFLFEIPAYKGSLKINGLEANKGDLKYSYVEQEPFIFPDSIRNNILFGRDYDKSLYLKVLRASQLEHDIIQMKYQDHTEIGEKGTNLSGGQKARLSLARALYQMADVYLLDDPLSAVDANVARNIFHMAIKEFIQQEQPKLQPNRKKPVIILVTHQVQYALECDRIGILSEGTIVAQGTYEQIKSQLNFANEELALQISQSKQQQQQYKPQDQTILVKLTQTKTNNLTVKEEDAELQVTMSTYNKYFKLWTYAILIIVLLLNGSAEVFNQLYIRSVSNFSSYQEDNNQNYGFLILGMMAISLYINNLIKYILNAVSVQYTTQTIHNKMLKSITLSPVSYFDTNPSGRIINRFSNDLSLGDTQSNIVLLDIWEICIFFFACLITLAVLQQYFLILVFFILMFDLYFFTFFKKMISQLKENELIQRSPLFDFLKKTLGGVVQVRAYHQQEWFRRQFLNLSNKLNISNLTFYYSTRCFGFVIDVIGLCIQIIGFYMIIPLDGSNIADYSQALLLLTQFNDYLQWGLRQLIQFETQMNSYNRMFEIIDLPHEAPHYQQIDKQIQFPKDGSVDFENVQMRYRQETDLILKGMNFNIKNGEKIGCVGRTGAGKSSILQVLFRMAEIDQVEGSFVRIGGQDTKQLGLNNLRSNIGIIPQSPFLFSGTIRRNLDPLNQFTDDQLWQSLIDTDLYDHIKKFQQGLQTDMSDVNSVFSVGQKQLICLARTILTKRKIIVLDEATANVDMKTDDFIQQKLKEKFPDCTIITIAHRLNTIADYDKVMVISDGRVKEFDSPFRLLANSEKSTSIDTDTEFAKLVRNTGEQNSNAIFHVAKNSFFTAH